MPGGPHATSPPTSPPCPAPGPLGRPLCARQHLGPPHSTPRRAPVPTISGGHRHCRVRGAGMMGARVASSAPGPSKNPQGPGPVGQAGATLRGSSGFSGEQHRELTQPGLTQDRPPNAGVPGAEQQGGPTLGSTRRPQEGAREPGVGGHPVRRPQGLCALRDTRGSGGGTQYSVCVCAHMCWSHMCTCGVWNTEECDLSV